MNNPAFATVPRLPAKHVPFSGIASAVTPPIDTIMLMQAHHLADCAMLLTESHRGKHHRLSRPAARQHLHALLQNEQAVGFVFLDERCRVIAFAVGCERMTREQTTFDIDELCVCAAKQHSRVGTQLVQYVEQAMRAQGIAHVTLGAAQHGAHTSRLLRML